MNINIFTSYYANIPNIPQGYITVSIAGKCPSFYNGLEYKKVAPKIQFFTEWKKNNDNDYYTHCYNEQVLNTLNATDVVQDIINLAKEQNYSNNLNIVLLCYEKPNEFCHRHLLSNWLYKYGYIVEEL